MSHLIIYLKGCIFSAIMSSVSNSIFLIIFPLKVSVADLPGLIEDAHLNKGMGHRFLRHTERTKLITLVVDIDGFQLKSTHPFRSPVETIILLLKELLLYQDLLLERPLLLVLNKMDINNAEHKKDEILAELKNVKHHPLMHDSELSSDLLPVLDKLCINNFQNVFPVSSLTGYGVDEFRNALYQQVPKTSSFEDDHDSDDDNLD